MGESLMLFSLKTEIQGYFLESKHFERLLKNLKQAIGVDFDGHHIYWTDIYSDHESIYRAKEDGSDKEVNFKYFTATRKIFNLLLIYYS